MHDLRIELSEEAEAVEFTINRIAIAADGGAVAGD